jgi:ABC-type transport system involved in cytochrome c biogenesis ATPase subunit
VLNLQGRNGSGKTGLLRMPISLPPLPDDRGR